MRNRTRDKYTQFVKIVEKGQIWQHFNDTIIEVLDVKEWEDPDNFHVYVKCVNDGDYLKDSLGNKVTELKVIDCYFTALYERVSNFA